MTRTLLFASLLTSLTLSAPAQIIGAGRAGPDHFNFEIYGGYGGMNSLEGSVKESKDSAILPGGLTVDLQELGVDDDISTVFWGAKAYNNWVQFLFDYRKSSLNASGTANREYRLNVDNLGFGDLGLDYLVIPVNSEYDIDAETTWLGLGVRVTPFTINPAGQLRFTPWLHFGVQWIRAEYDIDAGATTTLRYEGFPSRVYAVQGQASGKEEAGIPEYGFGAELRWLFDPSKEFGPEIVAQATWKMLDFQGAIDSIGVDKEDFKDIVFDYAALEMNVTLYLPLNESLDLIAGVYIEQVDVTATLEAKDVFGDYDRDVEISYTLYGVRAGFRF